MNFGSCFPLSLATVLSMYSLYGKVSQSERFRMNWTFDFKIGGRIMFVFFALIQTNTKHLIPPTRLDVICIARPRKGGTVCTKTKSKKKVCSNFDEWNNSVCQGVVKKSISIYCSTNLKFNYSVPPSAPLSGCSTTGQVPSIQPFSSLLNLNPVKHFWW